MSDFGTSVRRYGPWILGVLVIITLIVVVGNAINQNKTAEAAAKIAEAQAAYEAFGGYTETVQSKQLADWKAYVSAKPGVNSNLTAAESFPLVDSAKITGACSQLGTARENLGGTDDQKSRAYDLAQNCINAINDAKRQYTVLYDRAHQAVEKADDADRIIQASFSAQLTNLAFGDPSNVVEAGRQLLLAKSSLDQARNDLRNGLWTNALSGATSAYTWAVFAYDVYTPKKAEPTDVPYRAPTTIRQPTRSEGPALQPTTVRQATVAPTRGPAVQPTAKPAATTAKQSGPAVQPTIKGSK